MLSSSLHNVIVTKLSEQKVFWHCTSASRLGILQSMVLPPSLTFLCFPLRDLSHQTKAKQTDDGHISTVWVFFLFLFLFCVCVVFFFFYPSSIKVSRMEIWVFLFSWVILLLFVALLLSSALLSHSEMFPLCVQYNDDTSGIV